MSHYAKLGIIWLIILIVVQNDKYISCLGHKSSEESPSETIKLFSTSGDSTTINSLPKTERKPAKGRSGEVVKKVTTITETSPGNVKMYTTSGSNGNYQTMSTSLPSGTWSSDTPSNSIQTWTNGNPGTFSSWSSSAPAIGTVVNSQAGPGINSWTSVPQGAVVNSWSSDYPENNQNPMPNGVINSWSTNNPSGGINTWTTNHLPVGDANTQVVNSLPVGSSVNSMTANNLNSMPNGVPGGSINSWSTNNPDGSINTWTTNHIPVGHANAQVINSVPGRNVNSVTAVGLNGQKVTAIGLNGQSLSAVGLNGQSLPVVGLNGQSLPVVGLNGQSLPAGTLLVNGNNGLIQAQGLSLMRKSNGVNVNGGSMGVRRKKQGSSGLKLGSNNGFGLLDRLGMVFNGGR